MIYFCFHDWNSWSQPIATNNGGYKQQWKSCKHCNKAKFRTLNWDDQSQLSSVLKALDESTRAIETTDASCPDDKG